MKYRLQKVPVNISQNNDLIHVYDIYRVQYKNNFKWKTLDDFDKKDVAEKVYYSLNCYVMNIEQYKQTKIKNKLKNISDEDFNDLVKSKKIKYYKDLIGLYNYFSKEIPNDIQNEFNNLK
jgi:hypothetical protein